MAEPSRAVTVVIPARYGSSRFPGKPLIPLLGKPMIQHVYERAKACRSVAQVIVATDDERIQAVVEGFGGRAVLMTESYRTGTDRVAGVARGHAGDYFVDLQGDEILLDPELLSDLIEPCLAAGEGMATLKRQIDSVADLHNPGAVKVVTDDSGYALYFSKGPIPFCRNEWGDFMRRGTDLPDFVPPQVACHVGLYAYRVGALRALAAAPAAPIELRERLEQLRALWLGLGIAVADAAEAPGPGVDSPGDLARVDALMRRTVRP